MSEIHMLFATKALRDYNALENPRDYLGPHTEEVLKFWRDIEEFDKKILDEICRRADEFTEEMKTENYFHAYWKTKKVMGEMGFYSIWWSVKNFISQFSNSWAFCVATLEIIGGIENKVYTSLIYDIVKSLET